MAGQKVGSGQLVRKSLAVGADKMVVDAARQGTLN